MELLTPLTNLYDVPHIACDKTAFKRIVSEIINNACKYTPAHEQIVITASPNHPHGIAIAITNYGVELSEEEQQQIFDKFYRIPHSDRWKQGGTGLGLALVDGLIQQLGGQIQVNSQNNHVTFTMLFPQFIAN